jgi:ornithine cyclodeaminase/alanine dehydrogenase-like protein (mu-crystallin family)
LADITPCLDTPVVVSPVTVKSMPKHRLNIAMIGTGFIAKAHSNAFRQVGHFFDNP